MSGQGCVVQQGIVLAVEAIEGTDAMLAPRRRAGRPGPGGVLVKLVKPGQDRRADLPTIGPRTIDGRAAGLRGIAFEAGGTLFTDRAGCVARADAAGLFLLGLDPQTGETSMSRYLHTMIRVMDLDKSVAFYTKPDGHEGELRRREVPAGATRCASSATRPTRTRRRSS